jgi:hypothetical protein
MPNFNTGYSADIPGASQPGFAAYKRSLEPQPPAAPTMSAHEAAHWARVEQEREWKAAKERRRAEIARHEEEKRKWNQRVLADRAAAKQREAERVVAEGMIESVFQQYNCSPLEREIILKLVKNRTPELIYDPGAVEMKILAFRGEGL